MTAGTPRRAILAFGTASAVAAVTGCTVYGREDGTQAADEPGAGPDDAGDSRDSGDAADGDALPDGDAPPDGDGEVLVSTGDVEVGGGVILGDVVVTQPSDGEFKGFSAICTHQGCTVASISDGTINCPCHGSRFSIEDGSVVQAATGLSADSQSPLPEVSIVVDGDAIRSGPPPS